MDWVFVKNSLGEELRKNFEMEINGRAGLGLGWCTRRSVVGPKAGFAIAHNNRMIRVWPDSLASGGHLRIRPKVRMIS